MEPQSHGIGAKTIAAVIILVLLAGGIGAGASYYLIGGHPASAAVNTVTSTSTATSVVTDTVGANAASGNSSAAAAQQAINAVQIYANANESVVTIEGFISQSAGSVFGQVSQLEEVLGSGFIMTYNNTEYVITNFHVVDGATNMTVTFWNGDSYPASVVGTDPYSDLAIVKVPTALSSEYHPLALSSSAAVQVGEPVAAIGNPFGLSGSLTVGVVSALGRTITETTAGNYSIADIIQFSAPINPGNSGGPLLQCRRPGDRADHRHGERLTGPRFRYPVGLRHQRDKLPDRERDLQRTAVSRDRDGGHVPAAGAG